MIVGHQHWHYFLRFHPEDSKPVHTSTSYSCSACVCAFSYHRNWRWQSQYLVHPLHQLHLESHHNLVHPSDHWHQQDPEDQVHLKNHWHFHFNYDFFSLKKNFTFSFAPTETKQILHDDFSVTFHWVYFWIKSVWDRDQVFKILTQLIIMNLCEFRMQELQQRLGNSTVHCPVRWCVLQAKNWEQKIPISKMLLYS